MALRIDDCDVPLILKTRRWLNLDPKNDFEGEYRDLLAAIFDKVDKPPIGAPAAYLLGAAPGYDPVETTVWETLIRAAAEEGYPAYIDSLEPPTRLRELSSAAVRDAVDMLENDGLAKVQRYIGGRFVVTLTPHGWHERAGEVLGINVHADERSVLSSIASDGPCDGEALRTRTGIPTVRLMMALEWLDARGFVTAMKVLGGGLRRFHWVDCTAEGRREARR